MILLIHIMNIRDIDLNLLVILDALLLERNVTRAATRLGLSQPAVSNALARLRETLGDPLLVRSASGMIATPRAETLVTPIRQALSAIGAALSPVPTFDPSISQHIFTVASTDYTELVLIPPLMRLLADVAPDVRVEIRNMRERVPTRELEEGMIDLAIGHFPEVPDRLFAQKLFVEDFTCLVSEKNPALKKNLTLKRFAEMRHILISPFGGFVGLVDDVLTGEGLSRKVYFSTPHFMMAPLVLEGTEYILTLPRRVADSLKRYLPIAEIKSPLTVPPFEVKQVWHERTQHDAAHRWFRSVLFQIANKG